ncbi:MAG: hypothetical protein R3A10_17800 [Caldilineaceae bacterium]
MNLCRKTSLREPNTVEPPPELLDPASPPAVPLSMNRRRAPLPLPVPPVEPTAWTRCRLNQRHRIAAG